MATAASITNINIRLATPEDAIPLEQLINTAFRNDNTTQVFLSADHAPVNVTSVPNILKWIADPNTAVFVLTDADNSGSLLAHFSVRKLPADPARENRVCTWFGLLAVSVEHQNRGLGSKALSYAEEYARKEVGATRMEFSVVCTRKELIEWYMKRGYRETGEKTPFPYESHGNWRGVLREGLEFIVLGKDLGGHQ